MDRIRPIKRSEVQEILDRNREICWFIEKEIGPTTWKDLCEIFEITPQSLDNALKKGALLSPVSRGPARRKPASSYEVLKEMTRSLSLKTPKEYASCIRMAADKLEEGL